MPPVWKKPSFVKTTHQAPQKEIPMVAPKKGGPKSFGEKKSNPPPPLVNNHDVVVGDRRSPPLEN